MDKIPQGDHQFSNLMNEMDMFSRAISFPRPAPNDKFRIPLNTNVLKPLSFYLPNTHQQT